KEIGFALMAVNLRKYTANIMPNHDLYKNMKKGFNFKCWGGVNKYVTFLIVDLHCAHYACRGHGLNLLVSLRSLRGFRTRAVPTGVKWAPFRSTRESHHQVI